jgi:pimeloyl-ACP methyl ester carboxylesterase
VSRTKGLIGVGAGLAAAGVGAALGVAAERWSVERRRHVPAGEAYGSVRGRPRTVHADDGTDLYVEVDEPDPVDDVASDGQVLAERRSVVPTIVFSHGFCLTQDIWHYQRNWLRGRYRLVLWDQRGHGRSGEGPPGHYNVDQLGRDLHSVIEAVAPEGPIELVGHSMGGMTVMALAAQFPDLVRERVVGVALVATSSGGLAEVGWGLMPSLARAAHKLAPTTVASLARTPRLVARTRQVGRDLEELLVKKYSYASPVSPELVQFTARLIAATPLPVVAGFLPTFDLHDKGEALALLDGLEALVLSGEKDLLTPPDHSEEIVRRLPGAEHVLIPDAGHLVMLEHPDDVNLNLGDLLDRVERVLEHTAS